MAHFYFDLHECSSVTPDPDGRDFASLDVAREAAIRDARAIMCGEIHNGHLCLYCHIDILDAGHRHLMRVPFTEAIEINDWTPLQNG
ncbi:MAG: hypothetical protein EOP94_02995 [Zymomonas sp.]|nr:MAG: hypothetical protein EOP94_02995 [Zymomonas sp.]